MRRGELLTKNLNRMTRQEFNDYLDELTSETGFDLTKEQKAFAYQAAKKYHEQALRIHDVVGKANSADRYTEKLDKDWDDDIYTIEEWKDAVNDGWTTNYDGSGYWVKDGLKSRDEVFSTPQLDATHVVWYNK